MISPPKRRHSSIPSRVLPMPVGPASTTSGSGVHVSMASVQTAVADLFGARGALHARERACRQALAATAFQLWPQQSTQLLAFALQQRRVSKTPTAQLESDDVIVETFAVVPAR